jgi:hypothetical protein
MHSWWTIKSWQRCIWWSNISSLAINMWVQRHW